jgi:hypothetical protein
LFLGELCVLGGKAGFLTLVALVGAKKYAATTYLVNTDSS